MSILHFLYTGFRYVSTLPSQLIEPINFLPEFIKDSLADSLNLIPFLFFIFVIIEIIERYFTKKRHLFVFFMKKIGPLFGSLFASIPQCGFSVIASTIYTRRILTRGTLISVYLATSDEAIPVLIADPYNIRFIFPIILIKIIIAIIVGYLVDITISYKSKDPIVETKPIISNEEGCCHHNLSKSVKTKEFWKHPIKHTINIFFFILIVSIILGYIISIVGTEENLAKYCLLNSPLQPILVSLIGLIPNCAISVMLTILFMKHTISFGALIAGLSSAGGLGILVLLNKNNDKKDTAIIITILLLTSSIVGLAIQYNIFNINYLFKFFGVEI
jgi:hypothetical protein